MNDYSVIAANLKQYLERKRLPELLFILNANGCFQLNDEFAQKRLYIIINELLKTEEQPDENQLIRLIIPKLYDHRAIHDLVIQTRDIFEKMRQFNAFQELHQFMNEVLRRISIINSKSSFHGGLLFLNENLKVYMKIAKDAVNKFRTLDEQTLVGLIHVYEDLFSEIDEWLVKRDELDDTIKNIMRTQIAEDFAQASYSVFGYQLSNVEIQEMVDTLLNEVL